MSVLGQGHGLSAVLQSPAQGGAIASAIVVHAIVRRTEPRKIRNMLAMLLLPPAVLSLSSYPSGPLGVLASFGGSLAIYLTTLALSVLVYRLSPFHPLAQYPGPLVARTTRWWGFLKSKQGVQHWYSHELFQQYGNVVRTGPNLLIIRDADALPVVLGARANWHKGEHFATSAPPDTTGSVLLMTDPADHGPRRKFWDRAVAPAAMRAYEPLVAERTDQLCKILESRCGKSFDLVEWIARATFDIMGDFAYGGAFELMADGDANGIVNLVHVGAAAVDVWGQLPWMRPMMQYIPSNKFSELYAAALAVAEQRRERGSRIRDLFYYLTDEDGENGRPNFNSATLAIEASLALIAGSETVSTALLNIIFYLLAHPRVMAKLRAELDAAVGSGTGEIELSVLAQLPYLRAVINETIRLQPALSNGTQRAPPPGSGPWVVAGHVIPPGTTVQIPTWSLHRDERYFSPDPEMYWPERWTPEGKAEAEARGEEFRLEQGAYMPFSFGPTACAGRALALTELRLIVATLLKRFDIRFADGYTQQQWLDGLVDRFALATEAPLMIVLNKRS